MTGSPRTRSRSVTGLLVLPDAVAGGRVVLDGDRIAAVEPARVGSTRPIVAPGFIDIHVHGWGGYEATGGDESLEGMAAALVSHGVTSFLPTADTAGVDDLARFAAGTRAFARRARHDRAEALGANLEGPFLSPRRAGAQRVSCMREPNDVEPRVLSSLVRGVSIMTIAPELPGAPALIERLAQAGVRVSLGHSDASAGQAGAGRSAGARSVTHLFNAMSGMDHHAPGLAAVALRDDALFVELIADGFHVDPLLWPIVFRAKPNGRVVLVSDALSLAGSASDRAVVGGLPVEITGSRCVVSGDGRLAGSLIALDTAVRNLVRHGIGLPVAIRAATANPADLLGLQDRGRIAVGQLADLVELDRTLAVTRVMKRGRWLDGAAA